MRIIYIFFKMRLLAIIFFFAFISCQKERFDVQNPDVDLFVKQLKAGDYHCYHKNEEGENLWLLMPGFRDVNIPALLKYASDTAVISDFPVNPMSSRRPFPPDREYFILAECLLWTIEGIRNGTGFGSLDPYLVRAEWPDNQELVKGTEILVVRQHYQEWWSDYKNGDWKSANPLKDADYRWF
jgi:hypothetical protein